MIKKYLQKIFKKISYGIFLKIYGPIKDSLLATKDNRIDIKRVEKENNIIYKVYNIPNGRLYTDRIHNIAAIIDAITSEESTEKITTPNANLTEIV